MNNDKLFTIKIAILSFLLLSIKYFISYSLNFNEDIFFKIFKLSEIDFYEYAHMVESLSNLNFKLDWSIKQPAEKIQGFPIFSFIWHSAFFSLFGYYSFILLEFFLYFLLLFIFFKVIIVIQNDYQIAFFSLVFLLFSLEFIIFLINNHDFYFLNKIKLPLYDIFSHRFPRPLVTSIYFFSIFYFIFKIIKSRISKINKKYFFLLGLSFAFLINSYFYLSITCLLTLVLFLILKFKKKIFFFIDSNRYGFSILSGLILFGLIIIFLQTIFSEPSHFFRMGGFEISSVDKLYIAKIFLIKIFQIEIVLLLILSFLIKFNYTKLKILKKNQIYFDFLFYFFLCSFISPLIFVIVSHKVIALNHFWTNVKFAGFFYIYLVFVNFLFNNFFKNKINYISYLTILLLLILNFSNSLLKEKNFKKKFIKDQKSLKTFLITNNFKDSNLELLSDDETINHLWLSLKNKNLIQTNGFILSQTDSQIENSIFNQLKIFQVSEQKFTDMLNEQYTGRNSFALAFKYKYSVNSVRHFTPLFNEYNLEDINSIKKISPLVQWKTILPNSEKKRFLKKFNNFKIKKKLLPDIFILKNIIKDDIILSLGYKKVFSNSSYLVFTKN